MGTILFVEPRGTVGYHEPTLQVFLHRHPLLFDLVPLITLEDPAEARSTPLWAASKDFHTLFEALLEFLIVEGWREHLEKLRLRPRRKFGVSSDEEQVWMIL